MWDGICRRETMTALEYMERQLKKHRMNLERESCRNVPSDMIYSIIAKVHHYEAAVEALRKEADGNG